MIPLPTPDRIQRGDRFWHVWLVTDDGAGRGWYQLVMVPTTEDARRHDDEVRR